MGVGTAKCRALPSSREARAHQGRLCTFGWEAEGMHDEVGTANPWGWHGGSSCTLAGVTLCAGPRQRTVDTLSVCWFGASSESGAHQGTRVHPDSGTYWLCGHVGWRLVFSGPQFPHLVTTATSSGFQLMLERKKFQILHKVWSDLACISGSVWTSTSPFRPVLLSSFRSGHPHKVSLLSPQLVSSTEQGVFLYYLACFTLFLAHSRYSVNLCWVSKAPCLLGLGLYLSSPREGRQGAIAGRPVQGQQA